MSDRDARASRPPALIVSGPTASGKSALALALARDLGGTVVNADAMQCYRELRVLTARPTAADERVAPHRLYGTRPASIPGTAASWRTDALAALADATASGRLPILCGGTGLYLTLLAGGLADIPDPGTPARTEARALLAASGSAALHARLAAVDPETASSLRPSDGQRVARAWEVWRGTGRGLARWRRERAPAAGAPYRFAVVLLRPDRAVGRATIARRFDAMLDAGAVSEVAALLALGLDGSLPAMRAHGVPELAAHLRGELGRAEARDRAVAATVRYTRRQDTWFRHHQLAAPADTVTFDNGAPLSAQQMTSLSGFLRQFLSRAG